MSAMTHNHSFYQARLEFVHDILTEKFDLAVCIRRNWLWKSTDEACEKNARVDPVAYDHECPFKYNNFVYYVSLPSPLIKDNFTCQSQTSCVAIPSGCSELILRLANPDAEGLQQASNRIENEVAIMTLAARALDPSFNPHVVPRIYGWRGSMSKEGKRQQGWILQEYMPGTPLDENLDNMSLKGKRNILGQIAKLLKGLQDFALPDSITDFGGLTFDNEGDLISAPMTNCNIGPWPTYEASFKAQLEHALKKSDENPYIQGWRPNGVRARLEAFIEREVSTAFEQLEARDQKVITHADFSKYMASLVSKSRKHTYTLFLTAPSNLLFDASSGRITALIDYELSCITHPSYEFFRSFDGFGGRIRGCSVIEGRKEMSLDEAMLHGFPDPLPDCKDGDEFEEWELAKAWEDELERTGCKRPIMMPGIDKVANVYALLRSILPWRVTNADIVARQSDEVIRECQSENEVVVIQILEHSGF
ncbi:hypothetical protein N7537_010445 [Penicillium hordei]|uniref:Aminoglycoside phosphotransferase domain-containing protein n=1 Tax=Penicillium hordei TaxID=40994 RepID=A0AAD6DUZ9_9EURO|nr:uncharacterized protein N7537_010445 [Penicillium hordei]KAJ5593541.1 hypothetical protein N7537_010445 [Penicillium hordei]